MQFGLIISVILHAALLAWALITIQSQRDLGMAEPDPIITDLVSESELTKLKQGARSAKQLEAVAKESPKADLAKKEAAKLKPVATAPAPPPPEPPAPKPDPIEEKLASAQPPPPLPPPVDEKKNIEEQARQAQEKLKVEEQRKADEKRRAAEEEVALEGLRKVEQLRKAEEERKAEEQRKAEEERKADEQRKAEEQRRAEEQRQAEEKRRLEEEQRKQAELKKKADDEKKRKEAAAKKKRDDEKKRKEAEAKQKQFDAEKIAALLNKVPNSAAPTPSSTPTEPTKAKGPALGAPEGRDKQISASEIAMLKGRISARLRGCWRLPSGGGGSDTPIVTLRWRLKPDGSLDGDPQVEQPRSDALFRVAAEAAVRAVRDCSPFDLPSEKYNTWRTITWDFDPSQMM